MMNDSTVQTGLVTMNAKGVTELAIFNKSLLATISELTIKGSVPADAILTNLDLAEMQDLVNNLVFQDESSGRTMVASRLGGIESLSSVVRDAVKHSFNNRMHHYYDRYADYDVVVVDMLKELREELNASLTDDMIMKDLQLNHLSRVAKLMSIVSLNKTDAFLDYSSRNYRFNFNVNLLTFALENDIA